MSPQWRTRQAPRPFQPLLRLFRSLSSSPRTSFLLLFSASDFSGLSGRPRSPTLAPSARRLVTEVSPVLTVSLTTLTPPVGGKPQAAGRSTLSFLLGAVRLSVGDVPEVLDRVEAGLEQVNGQGGVNLVDRDKPQLT